MRRNALLLLVLLLGSSLPAAGQEILKVRWDGFAREVAARGLAGREVSITSAAAGVFRTRLLSVENDGLRVRAARATKQWASGKKEANIPKDQVRSVRFHGHTGHRGVWTGLPAFGAALGIGMALAESQDALQISEGPAAILVPVFIAAGAIGSGIAGYFIGRATSPRRPEFVIEP
ncbi:MAG: hypothetical protein IT165_08010 [Bryobacterales bacterium]|nr:hypothetical protein [Bryobacterales bacterium]